MRNPFLRGPLLERPVVAQEPDTLDRDSDTKHSGKASELGHGAVVEMEHPVTPVDKDTESFTAGAQDGVRKMEATTSIWSRNHLIAAYVLMWIVTFVDAMQQGSSGALVPYVTSSFAKHSLTAYTSIMSSVIGGVLRLPLSKVLDIFGRPHGFALMIACLMIGLIMMAVTSGVQMYSAAQIFYWVGYNGMAYVLTIFIADTSHLKNRGFMFAYVSSPYIITVWVTGPLASAFLNGPGWRWFYGAFVIITFVAALPLFLLFQYNYRQAVKAGLIVPAKSDRSFVESVKYYMIEFDIGGLILLMGGLVFFLLPFSLYVYQPGGWKSPMIISFITLGVLMLIGFAFFEKYVAPRTFMPYELLLDRTLLGACLLSAVFFISFYQWNAYFFSFLQVVPGLNITHATYVTNIYSIGSCFWSIVVGVLIRSTGRFKWLALYFGVPVTMLGTGLMIHFRQSYTDIGMVVMSQIFIAFAGGAIVITQQVAAMAATNHQYLAVVIALEGMFSSVGGGIGSSIASAVWNGIFPVRLATHLPEGNKELGSAIYSDLSKQLAYPKGTEIRLAIEKAYGDTQKWMCTGATAVLFLALAFVLMWRNINVKEFKQVKGRVV